MNKLSETGSKATPRLNLFITFTGFLDTHLLIPIIALYAVELGAGTAMVGLIVGVYSMTNTPANIIFGKLIDRVGAKVPLIIGLTGDAIALFCYSLCVFPAHLILVRVAHGLSGGIVGPATMSIAAGQSSAGREGRSMAFYGMALAVATLVGYGLGGVLASRLGYDVVFYVGSFILVLGIGAALLIPRSNRSGSQGLLSTGAYWGAMVSLLKRRRLLSSYCSIFAQYFAFGSVVTLLPLYVEDLGMEAFHVGMLLVIFVGIFLLLQLPSGILSDRVGRRAPAGIGLCLGIVSLALLPAFEGLGTLAVVMFLFGVSYALVFPSISAMIADETAVAERGLATGIFHALITAGVAVGAPLTGWVAEMSGISWGLALSCGVLAVSFIVVLTAVGRGHGGTY
ncbi:MAG TPA: MFS transporter [Dehalococcoidia bacterium]|nr:MFS transporter [Dehalococcoidia bacterium]